LFPHEDPDPQKTEEARAEIRAFIRSQLDAEAAEKSKSLESMYRELKIGFLT